MIGLFALLLTIALCLAIGIGLGYTIILAILNGFNPHKTVRQAAPALAASTSAGQ
jgi:hypothetical protein